MEIAFGGVIRFLKIQKTLTVIRKVEILEES